MEGLVLTSLIGFIAGTISGVIPGIGALATVALFFPILNDWAPMEVLTFYISLLISAQFINANIAINFGVLGESSSGIAAGLGHRLSKRGLGTYLIVVSAIGSLVASALAIILLPGAAEWVFGHARIYSINIRIVILFAIIIILLLYRRQFKVNLLLLILGGTLGVMGYNTYWGATFQFGQEWLGSGFSFITVIGMLFILPQLVIHYQDTRSIPKLENSSTISNKWFTSVSKSFKTAITLVRGTLLGLIAGLLPMVGTSLSSYIAAFFEKRWANKPTRTVIAAETANNSAVVSSLLPLVVFGIPITASEMIIFNIISAQTSNINYTWFMSNSKIVSDLSNLELLLVVGAIVSLIAAFVTLKVNKFFRRVISTKLLRAVYVVAGFITVAAILGNAWMYHQMVFELCTIAGLLIPFWLIVRYKIDSLSVIMAFLVAQPVLDTTATFINLYF